MASHYLTYVRTMGVALILPVCACGSSDSSSSSGAPVTDGGASGSHPDGGTGTTGNDSGTARDSGPGVGPSSDSGSTGTGTTDSGSTGTGGTDSGSTGTGGTDSGATGGGADGGPTAGGPSVIGSCDPSNLADTTCLPPQPVAPTACAKVPAPRKVTAALNDGSAASKSAAVPETATDPLDNALITAAFTKQSCVELTTGTGGADAFLIGQYSLTAGQTLVIDSGVTVYGSRNPKSYGATCVLIDPSGAVSDTSVAADAQYDCGAMFVVTGDHAAIMGQGTIDGQGGEPLIGVSPPTNDIDTVANPTVPANSFSWWNVSDFQRHDTRAQGSGPGSAPNPALVRVHDASNFVLAGVNLYNSAFFHVQLNSDKFVVWGVNIHTPSNATSSAGQAQSNYVARNTDGIDPGASTGLTDDGYIVGSRISTGDDMVAIKGGAQGGANNIVIAHNHFGTGHGMSLGSSTEQGITNVHVYDLTVDGDVPVDPNTGSSDLNGLRIKSYTGAGGFVHHILFEDICTRDEAYPIDITANYTANPIVDPAGVPPDYQDINVDDFHQLNVNGPQHPFEVTIAVEGNSTHQASIGFSNVYVEKSTGSKGGPVLTVASTATLTGTMNIGDPTSNDPCTGKTWWPTAPTVP